MTAIDTSHARELLRRQVRRMAAPTASDRARRLVEALPTSAALIESYRMQGGSGLHSYTLTMARMETTLRDRRRALIRYCAGMGGNARRWTYWSRVLCSPFAHVTGTPQKQALREVARLERSAAARGRRAA